MARVFLSIGSNINRHENIRNCIKALEDAFGTVINSSVYESEAVGFDGDNFFNLVSEIRTELSVGELLKKLRTIEDINGRIRGCERFSARTLDIDILTYDEQTGIIDGVELPRDEILKNAFVLLPLAEIAADVEHPVVKQSYQQLWDSFDQQSQKLWAVPFSFAG